MITRVRSRSVRSMVVTSVTAVSALGALASPALAVKAPRANAAATFKAGGSINDLWVTDAGAGASLVLADSSGNKVATGTADSLGSYIFRAVRPKSGYKVLKVSGSTVQGSTAIKVLAKGANPPSSFYKGISLHEGLNYVTMRDGIKLAMTVRMPLGHHLDGVTKYPTFIEYSGYQTAAPGNLLDAIINGGNSSSPLMPASSTAVGALIGPLLGFATVSVQMRGSGCSGGAFDLFGLSTTYDGYDAIESVAAQPWVKGGKVGMGGISFSGISQLFVAGTQPPHLAAISPMSVTDDTYSGTGYPGGIFNNGFALGWISERMSDAQPAPGGGQPYARELVNSGDTVCADNQKLRLQTQDAVAQSTDNPYRTPGLFDDRSASTWIPKIKVPTFLVGQFQDEQTGGHFVESLSALSKKKDVWISLQNGVHADSLGPSTITRWAEFMNLFVGGQVPKIPSLVTSFSAALYTSLADAPAAPVLQSQFANYTSVDKAKADFRKAYPPVRLLMDNGAGSQGAGSIGATWDLGYTEWPIPSAVATNFFLGGSGALSTAAPSSESSASYVSDPSARSATTLFGSGAGDAWKAQPRYQWDPIASGKGLGWVTQPLTSDAIVAGPASLDLYLKSSASDTDLQVTVSEVRPDGNETYIQNGWLRASHRKLNSALSTASDPVPTHLQADASPLPSGQYTLVRVPIYPFAHAFRAGSRIRVTIEAPGGDRPSWKFDTIDSGSTTNTVDLGGATPSKLVLDVIPGANAKGTPLPGATALRGEPNRTYSAASNGG